eukprot:Em0007g1209a
MTMPCISWHHQAYVWTVQSGCKGSNVNGCAGEAQESASDDCLMKSHLSTVHYIPEEAIVSHFSNAYAAAAPLAPPPSWLFDDSARSEAGDVLKEAILTDSKKRKRDLILAWQDVCDAFGSVSHELFILCMQRIGLMGSIIDVVNDIYHDSTIAVRTG